MIDGQIVLKVRWFPLIVFYLLNYYILHFVATGKNSADLHGVVLLPAAFPFYSCPAAVSLFPAAALFFLTAPLLRCPQCFCYFSTNFLLICSLFHLWNWLLLSRCSLLLYPPMFPFSYLLVLDLSNLFYPEYLCLLFLFLCCSIYFLQSPVTPQTTRQCPLTPAKMVPSPSPTPSSPALQTSSSTSSSSSSCPALRPVRQTICSVFCLLL